jgi:hypothetical protein
MRIVLAAAAMAAVASCASSEEITNGTAGAIPDVPADQIVIGEVSGNVLDRYYWRATTPNGVYDCSTDVLRRNTFCSPATPETESKPQPQ